MADKIEPKTLKELLEAELSQLESDPEARILAKMEFGLTRYQAEASVAKRKEFLRVELGKTPKPRRSPKAAAAATALIIGLLMTVFALVPSVKADQQGFPQTFVLMTNIPLVINAGGVSNLLSTEQVNFGLTNEVILHRGTGEGLSWTFNGNSTLAGGNAGLIVAPSVDGTNIDAWQQWILIGHAFGVTNVTITTNWNVNQLTGYRALFVIGETNLTTGIVSNGPVFFNTPQGGP